MPYIKRKTSGAEVLRPKTITSASGWIATIGGERLGRPVVAWALLDDGEVIGLVQHGGEFVSAEQVDNFQCFRATP